MSSVFRMPAMIAIAVSTVLAVASAVPAQPRLSSEPVAGVLRPSGQVEDPVFGISAPALGLAREVEMFQWREAVGADGRPEYHAEWSAEWIDSKGFADPAGHENPALLPFASERWLAESALLDGRSVAPSSLWRDLDGWQRLSPDPTALPVNLALLFVADDVGLSTSEDPERPGIGDLRVRWLALPGGPVLAEVVSDRSGYRPGHEAARMVRMAGGGAIPGPNQAPRLASDLWFWLGSVLVLLLALGIAALVRARSRRVGGR